MVGFLKPEGSESPYVAQFVHGQNRFKRYSNQSLCSIVFSIVLEVTSAVPYIGGWRVRACYAPARKCFVRNARGNRAFRCQLVHVIDPPVTGELGQSLVGVGSLLGSRRAVGEPLLGRCRVLRITCCLSFWLLPLL
jgi:hypothetical protein